MEFLADEIEKCTKRKIGINTLKRLLGFLKPTKPHLYTLDTVAKYIGFRNWDILVENMQKNMSVYPCFFKYTSTYSVEVGYWYIRWE